MMWLAIAAARWRLCSVGAGIERRLHDRVADQVVSTWSGWCRYRTPRQGGWRCNQGVTIGTALRLPPCCGCDRLSWLCVTQPKAGRSKEDDDGLVGAVETLVASADAMSVSSAASNTAHSSVLAEPVFVDFMHAEDCDDEGVQLDPFPRVRLYACHATASSLLHCTLRPCNVVVVVCRSTRVAPSQACSGWRTRRCSD
jgi:hypothetical protein